MGPIPRVGQIWALAIKRDESALVSGGGDSVVQVWRDTTAEEASERMKQAELLLERSVGALAPRPGPGPERWLNAGSERGHGDGAVEAALTGSRTWPIFCK